MLFYLIVESIFLFMAKILQENEYQKIIENTDGSVRIIQKKEKLKSWWFRISKTRWFNDWKELTPTQRSILMSLWLYGGSKSFCWVSMRRLSVDLNCSTQTILRNIKILKKKKYITSEKLTNQKGKYNKYFLLK